MNQTRKYTWLLEKLRRFGKLSFKDISDKWEDDTSFSDGHSLSRATFNTTAILFPLSRIVSSCSKTAGICWLVTIAKRFGPMALTA